MRWWAELRRLGRDSPFTRRILALSVASFALLVLAGSAAFHMANRAAEVEGWIVHTMEVRDQARALLIQLLNAETGARAYVLTEDEKFLEPFELAQPSLRKPLGPLLALTSDNADQQVRLLALEPEVNERVEELRRIVALMRQGQRAEAAALVKSGKGRELMVAVRAQLDEVYAAESKLLAQRQESAAALRHWVLTLIGVCLLAAIGLAALIVRAMLHYVSRLESEAKLLQQTEATLRQSQKLEAIGQLTGGIAHDFNNLLTIVIGNLDTMKRRLVDDASEIGGKLRVLVDNALEASRSAARLTHRLLAFSRRQALDPKRVDLNRVVSSMSDLLRRTLGETVDVETVLAGGLWPTYADAHQLENVLINLATNARDAMPGGGRITIETANAYLDEAYVARFGDVPAGQYVMLGMADTGSGIAAETIDHVFEPFFTTKEIGKGTGLGLAMVHGFVKQSGGHIRLYSEVGHGTTVKIYLPRLRESEDMEVMPETPVRSLRSEVRGRAGEVILLVEDNDGVRTYTRSTLEELGYQVLEARDARQALRLLEEDPRVDLLFTDVVLPGGMSGRALADRIMHDRPRLPVLFTTGYTRNAIIHHGRLDPNVNLLNKPYTQQDLARKIRELIDDALEASGAEVL